MSCPECEEWEEAAREPIEKWSFQTLSFMGNKLLDEVYPESIFNGSSGDPGQNLVVVLPEALKRCEEMR